MKTLIRLCGSPGWSKDVFTSMANMVYFLTLWIKHYSFFICWRHHQQAARNVDGVKRKDVIWALIHSTVSHDSLSRKRMPKSKLYDVPTDLNLRCLHMTDFLTSCWPYNPSVWVDDLHQTVTGWVNNGTVAKKTICAKNGIQFDLRNISNFKINHKTVK